MVRRREDERRLLEPAVPEPVRGAAPQGLLRELYDRAKATYGREHVRTYTEAEKFGRFLQVLHRFRPARAFLYDALPARPVMITGEDPERDEAAFNLMYTYHYSLYFTHFYGDKGYRKTLRVALTGAILLAVDSSIALGKTSKTCQDFIGLVHRALGEQLDWSLDDLGFEPSEVEDLRNGFISPELHKRLRALADKS